MGYVVKLNKYFIVADGPLEIFVNEKGVTQCKSGVSLTPTLSKATVFDSVTDASKYQQVVGFNGKRGQIVKA
jgi:hypothetical protein